MAYEPSARAAALASSVATVHVGGLETAPFAPSTFDVVTLWSVIEHVHDPPAVLRLARGMLKPGGLLVLLLPNFGSLERRLFGRCFFGLDVPRHLYHFAPETIRTAVEQAGFGVEGILHVSGHDSLVGTLRALLGWHDAPATALVGDAAQRHRSLGQRGRGACVHLFVTAADRAGRGSQMLIVASR